MERRRKMMRFIGFGEWYSKDYDALLAFNRDVVQAERKKYPNRYPKKFLPDHMLMGPLPNLNRTDMCTVSFYEPTGPKQLSDLAIRWMPLLTYDLVPVMMEGAGLRYLAFAQYASKGFNETLARNRDVIQAERKKYPDRYPKKFLEDHWLMSPLPKLSRDGCSLAFYETDDQKQLTNIAMRWLPMMKFSFVQVAESTRALESWTEVTGKK
jgi:hypothetical protein